MPFWRSSVASPTSLPPRSASALERVSHSNSGRNDVTPTAPCPACGRQYDDGKRRPVTYVGCGHNVCRKCSGRDLKRNKCPVCAAASRTARVECDIIRPASGKNRRALVNLMFGPSDSGLNYTISSKMLMIYCTRWFVTIQLAIRLLSHSMNVFHSLLVVADGNKLLTIMWNVCEKLCWNASVIHHAVRTICIHEYAELNDLRPSNPHCRMFFYCFELGFERMHLLR
jgi:zinc-RING finger domain